MRGLPPAVLALDRNLSVNLFSNAADVGNQNPDDL